MAQRMAMTDDASFALQIRQLGDEELLDFWAQMQQFESSMAQEYPQVIGSAQDYERLILLELQLRSCSRSEQSRC